MTMMTYQQALSDGIAWEMRRDGRVFVAGEDVRHKWNTALYDEFGDKRVYDTPLSEAQIVGLGVGAAAMGLRPIIYMANIDFLGCAMDEIMNQAAKMTYMLGGQTHIPMVIRVNMGAGARAAAQHSQSIEAIFAHIPGLKVITPSTPQKAKGLMSQAIRDGNPVLCAEHKRLATMEEDVPGGAFALPFGKVCIDRPGRDITLISWSHMVHTCLEAASGLAEKGIDAEVIDIMSLTPLDEDGILTSVSKTGRALIVHEANLHGGFGGEIAARIADKGFDLLKKPVKRIGAPFAPVPFSPILEDAYIPNADTIMKTAFAMM